MESNFLDCLIDVQNVAMAISAWNVTGNATVKMMLNAPRVMDGVLVFVLRATTELIANQARTYFFNNLASWPTSISDIWVSLVECR